MGWQKDTKKREKILAIYLQGNSLRVVAKRIGVSMQRVHAIILEEAPRVMRKPHVRYASRD